MTISTEVMWIIGVFTTIIGSLVTAIVLLYMNSQRSFNNELKEGLQKKMKKHDHHNKKNQEQDIEILTNTDLLYRGPVTISSTRKCVGHDKGEGRW